ncbi:hypothetical protein D3C73_1306890 [compost metagenome]
MGHQRTEQYERRQSQRHSLIALLNLLQNQIIAFTAISSVFPIEKADQRASERKQKEQPRVIQPHICHKVQAFKEKSRRRP